MLINNIFLLYLLHYNNFLIRSENFYETVFSCQVRSSTWASTVPTYICCVLLTPVETRHDRGLLLHYATHASPGIPIDQLHHPLLSFAADNYLKCRCEQHLYPVNCNIAIAYDNNPINILTILINHYKKL